MATSRPCLTDSLSYHGVTHNALQTDVNSTPIYGEKQAEYLDLYSISATTLSKQANETPKSTYATSPKCVYNAPLIAYPKILESESKRWHLSQGNCNHWDCPRCGQLRAKHEYWRMVNGCEALHTDGHTLYMLTVTCRGKELSVSDAEQGYMQWTKRLNDAMRLQAKRKGKHFAYVAITERQKRGHPHSHYITTFLPDDTAEYTKLAYRNINGKLTLIPVDGMGKTRLWSQWLQDRAVSAGLGEQVDISLIRSHEAVSRYLGKYLFKDTMQVKMPKNWRRVRYSQNFPKGESMENPDAMPIVTARDWKALARKTKFLTVTNDSLIAGMARARGFAVVETD